MTDQPCLIDLGNSALVKELPLNTYQVLGNRFVFYGGGYFRLLPYPVLRYLFQKSDYVMTYFHPRDFDPSQPTISNLSLIRHFKSYYGLKYAEKKLINLPNDFNFIVVQSAVQSINWDSAENVRLRS